MNMGTEHIDDDIRAQNEMVVTHTDTHPHREHQHIVKMEAFYENVDHKSFFPSLRMYANICFIYIM